MALNTKWPDDAVDLASRLICECKSAGQIARALNEALETTRYTRNAVISFAHRYKREIWHATRPEPGNRKGHGLKPQKRKPIERKAAPMQNALKYAPAGEFNSDAVFALKTGQCRFIIGDLRAGGMFCEETAEPGGAFCEEHRAVCYNAGYTPVTGRFRLQSLAARRTPVRA